MSFARFEVLGAIRDAKCYSRSEKAVLNALVSRADAAGACWPEYKTLAEDTGYSRAAVAAALASLRDNRGPVRIAVQHQGRHDGSGGRGSNKYQLGLSPDIGLKAVESSEWTQPPLESIPQTQLRALPEGLSPEIVGVESKNPGVESRQWTGSSPRKLSKKLSKERERKTATRFPAEIESVFELWKKDTGRHASKLDEKRASKIRQRLAEGFTPEQLAIVFLHRRNDPWLMGTTERSTRAYDGIETLLRDRAQVERLLELTKPHVPGRNGTQQRVSVQRGADPAAAAQWGRGKDSAFERPTGS